MTWKVQEVNTELLAALKDAGFTAEEVETLGTAFGFAAIVGPGNGPTQISLDGIEWTPEKVDALGLFLHEDGVRPAPPD